jgi:RNase P subunit RPR2
LSAFFELDEELLAQARQADLPVVVRTCGQCGATQRLPIYDEGRMREMFHVKHEEE